MKGRKKHKQPRNFLAVSAHFRNSAGAMKSKRKWDDDERKTSRDWLSEAERDDLHEEEIRLIWCEGMEAQTNYSGSQCYCSEHPEEYEDHRKGYK